MFSIRNGFLFFPFLFQCGICGEQKDASVGDEGERGNRKSKDAEDGDEEEADDRDDESWHGSEDSTQFIEPRTNRKRKIKSLGAVIGATAISSDMQKM